MLNKNTDYPNKMTVHRNNLGNSCNGSKGLC